MKSAQKHALGTRTRGEIDSALEAELHTLLDPDVADRLFGERTHHSRLLGVKPPTRV